MTFNFFLFLSLLRFKMCSVTIILQTFQKRITCCCCLRYIFPFWSMETFSFFFVVRKSFEIFLSVRRCYISLRTKFRFGFKSFLFWCQLYYLQQFCFYISIVFSFNFLFLFKFNTKENFLQHYNRFCQALGKV